MATARPQLAINAAPSTERNIRERGGGSALCCPQTGWSGLVADGELRRFQEFSALEQTVDTGANQAGGEQHPLHRIWLLARLHELLDIVHQRVEITFERGRSEERRGGKEG